jgi:transcription initiation factor TFIIIB Brf1 subunit/transcription initiation factor TFIIB
VSRRPRSEDDDDRPPICPACGVTMGLVQDGEGVRYVCQECGFGGDERDA